jgi:putative membrane protein insertion efficiency factor
MKKKIFNIFRFVDWIISSIFLFLINIYRYFISPLLGKNCRFYPSCSNYAMEAIKKHGAIRGVLLSVKRIMKCHPFYPGGHDEVP